MKLCIFSKNYFFIQIQSSRSQPILIQEIRSTRHVKAEMSLFTAKLLTMTFDTRIFTYGQIIWKLRWETVARTKKNNI